MFGADAFAKERRLACGFIAALGAVAFSPGRARAETPASAGQQAEAEALFVEGKKLITAGDFPHACAKFAESERLDPAAGTLINLADCYEKNGQIASAWVTFREAATASERDGRQEWATQAAARAHLLDARLPTLTVEVPAGSSIDGLVIERDGVPLAPSVWGSALPIDPSTVKIEARAPGRVAFRVTVTVDGDHNHVVVPVPPLAAVVPPAAPAATPQPSDPPRRSFQRPLAIGVAGAGVISVGLGIAFGVVAISKNNEANSVAARDCPDSSRCPKGSSAIGLTNDARNAGGIADATFATGGGLLAVAAILYFTAPKGGGAVGPAVAYENGAWSASLAGRF
jgi:hypothetical protein